MTNDAIFLISDSGQLQRVEHQLYTSEDILQELVAKHPEVLAGDQMDPIEPPRWLLIRREATIPDSTAGQDRWWLDHLLLDQFGIPTLVEVKRSTDTRIRREVVGQMLDYIANAQAYWGTGRMRQMLADEVGSPDGADAKLAEHLRVSDEPEATAKHLADYWNRVEANMREGNVRLLFVADELPRELKRLIEFLNEQFTKIEVLGVELRQYVGQGIKALVPRVVGQTEAAREQKERSSPRPPSATAEWTTPEEFFAKCRADAAGFFKSVLEGARENSLDVSWGTKGFSVRAPERPVFFYCYPPGARGRGTSDIEIFLRDLNDTALANEIRSVASKAPGIETAGQFTLRLAVSSVALPAAEKILARSIDFMKRQRLITEETAAVAKQLPSK
jgi:hypothetical protein